jgi:hypothetical protein
MLLRKYIYSLILFLILLYNKYFELPVWLQFSIFILFIFITFKLNKKALISSIFYANVINFSLMSQFVPLSQNYLIIFLLSLNLFVFFGENRVQEIKN